jgi:hypothetical protein
MVEGTLVDYPNSERGHCKCRRNLGDVGKSPFTGARFLRRVFSDVPFPKCPVRDSKVVKQQVVAVKCEARPHVWWVPGPLR